MFSVSKFKQTLLKNMCNVVYMDRIGAPQILFWYKEVWQVIKDAKKTLASKCLNKQTYCYKTKRSFY